MFKSRRSPEQIAALNKKSAENAALLRRPTTEYIGQVTEIFREAHETEPKSNLPYIEPHQIAPDQELHESLQVRLNILRWAVSSNFTPAKKVWNELNPETADLRWLDRELRSTGITSKRGIKRETQKYLESSVRFHDIHFADLEPFVANELTFPRGLIALPTLENNEAGERLVDATVCTMQRIAELAERPNVISKLSRLSIDQTNMARKNDSGRGSEKWDNELGLRNTATRLVAEALLSTSQSTALLLGNVKKDFEITQALESLENNGTFKLLGLFPMGVIGPLAIRGMRWDPAYVLDTDLLENGEYAVSKDLRQNIIERHVIQRTLSLSKKSMREGRFYKYSINQGCPAKPSDMKFVVDLLVQELTNQT
jgi:hypothetical protein